MPPDPQHRRGPAPSGGLDQEAFARRLQAAAPVLWTIAAAVLGDRGKAEDVLQEAAVIALAKLDRFDPATSFAAWMGAIVRNVARNQARKDRRQATTPFPPELLAARCDADAARAERPGAEGREAPAARLPVDARGELLADSGAFDDAVVAALRTLRPAARAALLLRTVQGLDYQEIALVLGIPPGTAMSHVHRAREALRRRLTPEAGAPALAPAAQRGGAA
jgi:RNA polymerase sigma-70 factor (ECF subfamily)